MHGDRDLPAGAAHRRRPHACWTVRRPPSNACLSGSPASETGSPWLTGVVDPLDRGAVLSGFPLGAAGRFAALATCGTAERGDHIWRAGVGRAEIRRSEFRQASAAAADITADVLATAIVAGRRPMLNWATDSWDVEVLAVLGSGELLTTPGSGLKVREPGVAWCQAVA